MVVYPVLKKKNNDSDKFNFGGLSFGIGIPETEEDGFGGFLLELINANADHYRQRFVLRA